MIRRKVILLILLAGAAVGVWQWGFRYTSLRGRLLPDNRPLRLLESLQTPVTLDLDQAPVAEVLQEIQRQTGIEISTDISKTVTLACQDMPVETVIELMTLQLQGKSVSNLRDGGPFQWSVLVPGESHFSLAVVNGRLTWTEQFEPMIGHHYGADGAALSVFETADRQLMAPQVPWPQHVGGPLVNDPVSSLLSGDLRTQRMIDRLTQLQQHPGFFAPQGEVLSMTPDPRVLRQLQSRVTLDHRGPLDQCVRTLLEQLELKHVVDDGLLGASDIIALGEAPAEAWLRALLRFEAGYWVCGDVVVVGYGSYLMNEVRAYPISDLTPSQRVRLPRFVRTILDGSFRRGFRAEMLTVNGEQLLVRGSTDLQMEVREILTALRSRLQHSPGEVWHERSDEPAWQVLAQTASVAAGKQRLETLVVRLAREHRLPVLLRRGETSANTLEFNKQIRGPVWSLLERATKQVELKAAVVVGGILDIGSRTRMVELSRSYSHLPTPIPATGHKPQDWESAIQRLVSMPMESSRMVTPNSPVAGVIAWSHMPASAMRTARLVAQVECAAAERSEMLVPDKGRFEALQARLDEPARMPLGDSLPAFQQRLAARLEAEVSLAKDAEREFDDSQRELAHPGDDFIHGGRLIRQRASELPLRSWLTLVLGERGLRWDFDQRGIEIRSQREPAPQLTAAYWVGELSNEPLAGVSSWWRDALAPSGPNRRTPLAELAACFVPPQASGEENRQPVQVGDVLVVKAPYRDLQRIHSFLHAFRDYRQLPEAAVALSLDPVQRRAEQRMNERVSLAVEGWRLQPALWRLSAQTGVMAVLDPPRMRHRPPPQLLLNLPAGRALEILVHDGLDNDTSVELRDGVAVGGQEDRYGTPAVVLPQRLLIHVPSLPSLQPPLDESHWRAMIDVPKERSFNTPPLSLRHMLTAAVTPPRASGFVGQFGDRLLLAGSWAQVARARTLLRGIGETLDNLPAWNQSVEVRDGEKLWDFLLRVGERTQLPLVADSFDGQMDVLAPAGFRGSLLDALSLIAEQQSWRLELRGDEVRLTSWDEAPSSAQVFDIRRLIGQRHWSADGSQSHRWEVEDIAAVLLDIVNPGNWGTADDWRRSNQGHVYGALMMPWQNRLLVVHTPETCRQVGRAIQLLAAGPYRLEKLVEMLGSEDAIARSVAMRSLIGRGATPPALAALRRRLLESEDDSELKLALALAIHWRAGMDPERLNQLARGPYDRVVKRLGLSALAHCGQQGAELIAAELARHRGDSEDQGKRRHLLEVLGANPEVARHALPQLLQVVAEDSQFRDQARQVIEGADPQGEATYRLIQQWLDSDDPKWRGIAQRLLPSFPGFIPAE